MKIVIVDKAEVELDARVSQLYVDGKAVPLRLVEMLVLGHDVKFTSSLVLKLSKEGISILCISKNNENMALTLPQFSKNSEIKMDQYAALNQRLGMAKYFVDEKIVRHGKHLKSMGIEIDDLMWKEKVQNVQSVENLLGIEGNFSKVYFQHYFSQFSPTLHKGKRSKRPALDPVNAMLSYVYSIVYNLLTAKLYMAGFEPSISYLHTPYRSHYALSSDFMELFRSQINEKVLEWFTDGLLVAEDFTFKNAVYLKYANRKKLWPQIKSLMSTVSKEADKEISLIRTAIA
ncbi:MAG: CRISPR-associated endonuclease Cas1 [Sulfurovum sp.]|nr:CRISPR-associated endonuclease Cas1 [Sulfurovum sp.]